MPNTPTYTQTPLMLAFFRKKLNKSEGIVEVGKFDVRTGVQDDGHQPAQKPKAHQSVAGTPSEIKQSANA